MSNQIIRVFENNDMSIAATMVEGEPWFVAKDIMRSIGYEDGYNVSRALSKVPSEWKGVHRMNTLGGDQKILMLTEQGLYFFLSRSNKPSALPFQKWVAGEVLPSIRQSGGYILGKTPDEIMENAMYAARWKIDRLESKSGYVLMTDAVRDYAIRNGRTADAGEYILEAELLNLIILDCSSREWRKQRDIKEKELIRDSMCIKKLKSYAALEKLNATLIDLDFPLEVRREKLKEHFKRKLCMLDD